jgi:hypothetical protein
MATDVRMSARVFVDDTELLRSTVERQHGGTAMLVQSVPVTETFQGATVWEGVVHVFDLADNPRASRAYAWSSPIEGSDKRRFFAVLHIPPIDSPLTAVRAAIVAEHRK